MANGDDKAKAKKKAQNRSRITIEPAPNSPGIVIDPRDPNAQRRFEIQQRGGAYSDRLKYSPGIGLGPTMRPKDKMKRG